MRQHRQYCDALETCGLKLTCLAAEAAFSDGTFVEAAAIVTPRGAIVARPGARTRVGEIESMGRALAAFFPELAHIDAPGTLDGGDVCEADGSYLIGVSARTNEPGAKQLKGYLERLGYSATLVDIRTSARLLHLKTGIAYVGQGIWVTTSAIERELIHLEAVKHEVISVGPGACYAANCVRINDRVLVAAGPAFTTELEARGLRPLPLDMSEFKKMDGGLSCLSLRF